MAGKSYNVVFSGRMAEGKTPAEILSNLCSVLKLEEHEVRELFKAGAGAIVQQDLEGQKAYGVRDNLRDAGVICTVQEIVPPSLERTYSGSGPASVKPHSRHIHRPLPRSLPPASSSGSSGFASMLFKAVILAALIAGSWWAYHTYSHLLRPGISQEEQATKISG